MFRRLNLLFLLSLIFLLNLRLLLLGRRLNFFRSLVEVGILCFNFRFSNGRGQVGRINFILGRQFAILLILFGRVVILRLNRLDSLTGLGKVLVILHSALVELVFSFELDLALEVSPQILEGFEHGLVLLLFFDRNLVPVVIVEQIPGLLSEIFIHLSHLFFESTEVLGWLDGLGRPLEGDIELHGRQWRNKYQLIKYYYSLANRIFYIHQLPRPNHTKKSQKPAQDWEVVFWVIFKIQMNTIGDILHQEEIREIIRKIMQFDIKDFASSLWFKQDENMQKLNMQLHVNAIMKNDEFILEECVAQDKFKTLIYDLIMTSIWKERVLSQVKTKVTQMNSMKLYLTIYHESVICNILQVLMFHRTAIDESGDFLIQVIDYCYKKISKQVRDSLKNRKAKREEQAKKEKMTPQQKKEKKMKSILKRNPVEQLERQVEDVEFNLFIMSISILRYITDYIKHLEIGILHHLLVQCNIYSILVPLIEERPWLRQNDQGEREIYQNSKWTIVPKAQYGRLPKTQAQVWIAIYNLFMDPECRKKYELNDQRKNNLLKLRKFMNEVLLDQIPPLAHMLRSLEELSMMNVPTHLTINPFVVEQVPIIATQICNNRDWKQLSEEHHLRLCQSMDESERQQMQRLADLYTNNTVEGLLEGFKCKKCEKQAFKRCSKCKSVWYCSRECQVGDWPEHKPTCNKLAKEAKEAEEQKKQQPDIIEQSEPKKALIDELD